MARLNVSPTRMELSRLKKRLATARRGHKLLKDKRDELMKKFLKIIRKNQDLRFRLEDMALAAERNFVMASALMSEQNLEEALMYPSRTVSTAVSVKNIMGVEVPVFDYHVEEGGELYCYGFANTSAELDDAVNAMNALLPVLLELAAVEKSAQLMAHEIEKTRRRVNALEYVMIPQLEETIRYISMKMEENERGNITRLMKVKDMVLENK